MANLAEEVRTLEDRHQTARVLRTLQQHSTEQTAALDRIYEQLVKVKAESRIGPNVLKISIRRCKLHRVQLASCAMAPCHWLTGSGLHFGTWAFTSHPDDEETPPDAKCKKCFPGAAADAASSATSGQASSSSGSSGWLEATGGRGPRLG